MSGHQRALDSHVHESQINWSTEILALLLEKSAGLSSELKSLSQVMEKELLKVGGRWSNSFLEEDSKHPSILPGYCELSVFLIRIFHHLTMYMGYSTYPLYSSKAVLVDKGMHRHQGHRNQLRHLSSLCSLNFRTSHGESPGSTRKAGLSIRAFWCRPLWSFLIRLSKSQRKVPWRDMFLFLSVFQLVQFI